MRHHRSHVTCAVIWRNCRRSGAPFGEVTAGRQVLTGPKCGRAPGVTRRAAYE